MNEPELERHKREYRRLNRNMVATLLAHFVLLVSAALLAPEEYAGTAVIGALLAGAAVQLWWAFRKIAVYWRDVRERSGGAVE